MFPLVEEFYNFILILLVIFPIASIGVIVVGKLIKEKTMTKPISEWTREIDRVVRESEER